MKLEILLIFASFFCAICASFWRFLFKLDAFLPTFLTAFLGVAAYFSCKNFLDVAVFRTVPAQIYHILDWLNVGDFNLSWSVQIDSLSSLMFAVVNCVSFLVHLYSTGYMSEDEGKARYFIALSAFTFFMLLLVSSSNFFQLFVGWEGVGLCSYLLIGFFYHKNSANSAAVKAFVVNRVGDFGLIVGIATLYYFCNSLNFADIFGNLEKIIDAEINLFGLKFNALNFACFALFVGCMGKSAQLGLHVWLPDAMEGPTPVSALIHAATMVTAGVFLLARCSPLFENVDFVRTVIVVVGITTSFFAATVAICQTDIKKIVAYSTCSQLGYMFAACGVSAYSVAMFHLATHACFKALLFLSAGSVIHALHHEQDIRNMGGLWKKLPVTYVCMLIGTLALSGIPPFAGYYSKDAIIESLYMSGGSSGYFISVISAVLTACYSWKSIFVVFHGKFRGSDEAFTRVHESPFTMLLPMIILALGSIACGYIGSVLHVGSVDFWNGSISVLSDHFSYEKLHDVPAFYKYLPLALSVGAIVIVYFKYVPYKNGESKFPMIEAFLKNAWHFDCAYNKLIIGPLRCLSGFLSCVMEKRMIDGVSNGIVRLSDSSSEALLLTQNGKINCYVLYMVCGLAAAAIFMAVMI